MRVMDLNVYRHDYSDSWDPNYDPTNGGVSGRYNSIMVVCDTGNNENIDPDNPPENLFMLVGSSYSNSPRLVPRRATPNGLVGPMFGGNYADTSDSRWGKMVAKHFGDAYRFTHCLPIFDRYETPEQYRILCS